MKNFSKKSISLGLIFTILMAIFMPTMVNATDVNRIGSSMVKSIVIAYTGGNSQVYVNKITKQDGTVVRYVYSRNFIVTPDTIAKLKSVLASEYSSLIPDDYTGYDNVGIKVCSDASLVDSMNENWTSSEWVGRNVIATREIKDVTNEDGDGINQTAISNAQSHTVLFNEIKNYAELGNRAIWEAIELEKKANWDAAEAEHHASDPTYVPQEYVYSEYVPLDFGELTASDIENTRTLEQNQIELSVGTSQTKSLEFINNKLVESVYVTSVNHVASIYSSHTTIDDSESITKINSLNISIKNPIIGDTATATTKPSVTIDSNPNYEIDHIAYVTAYPSEKPAGEYDAPFTGTFEANKDYVVEVSLKAKDGFAFVDNNGMTLKVNGKTTGFEKNEWNSDGSTYYMFFAKVQATAEEESKDTTTYEFLEGANQTYTIGTDGTATFRVSADFSLFENGGAVYVDGTETKEFTASSGSTIITLSKDFMSSLSEGEHTLKVAFNNGKSAETKFTVAKANTTEETTTITENTTTTSNNPKTGDNIITIFSIFAIATLGTFTTLKLNRNRKTRKH